MLDPRSKALMGVSPATIWETLWTVSHQSFRYKNCLTSGSNRKSLVMMVRIFLTFSIKWLIQWLEHQTVSIIDASKLGACLLCWRLPAFWQTASVYLCRIKLRSCLHKFKSDTRNLELGTEKQAHGKKVYLTRECCFLAIKDRLCSARQVRLPNESCFLQPSPPYPWILTKAIGYHNI